MFHREEVFFAFPLRIAGEARRFLNELGRQPWNCNRELRLWTTAVYLYETVDAFMVEAALPEADAEGLKIEIDGNDLVVRRKRAAENYAQRDSSEDRQCESDEVARIPLPQPADKATLLAQFRDGVLRVVIRISTPASG